MAEIRDHLWEVHDELQNKQKNTSLISDTGTMEDGWVVYTVSCKKKDLMKKINYLTQAHEEGYPIK